jgi:polyisoprenyl-phosphate glycosyltransferase
MPLEAEIPIRVPCSRKVQRWRARRPPGPGDVRRRSERLINVGRPGSEIDVTGDTPSANEIKLSVVVPVYNSEKAIRGLWDRLRPALVATTDSFELICVDDGSRDGSWSELQRLVAEHPGEVTAIRLMRNFGQHNALMCGFRKARGEYIVTLDDDLQNPPEEIPRLLEAIRSQQLDVVYGIPSRRAHAGYRNLSSRLVNMFFRAVFRTTTEASPYRILHRDVVRAILSYTLNFTYVDGLLAWNTQRIGAIEVEHHPRQAGRSGYSLSKLAVLALNLFTNFSLLPLQVVALLGLVTAGGGIALATYYAVLSLAGQISVPGYASLIVTVLVLGGIQLLALGILGEYIGRLHLNMNRKPQYTIREMTRIEPSKSAPDGSAQGDPVSS